MGRRGWGLELKEAGWGRKGWGRPRFQAEPLAGRLRWRGVPQPPREGLGQEAERKGPGTGQRVQSPLGRAPPLLPCSQSPQPGENLLPASPSDPQQGSAEGLQCTADLPT